MEDSTSTAVAEAHETAAIPARRRVSAPAEQRVVLRNISWDAYERLLADLGDNRSCRLAYDRGVLEIMAPQGLHERSSWLIGRLVPVIAEESARDIVGAGSLTCKREDIERGLEPDRCFYIQHEAQIRHKLNIDLHVDPPPDLMIEIDISRSSIGKFDICAALGVPELWRFDGQEMKFYKLDGERYIEVDSSPAFGTLPLKEIPRFLERAREVGETAMLREFRKWVRKHLRSTKKAKRANR